MPLHGLLVWSWGLEAHVTLQSVDQHLGVQACILQSNEKWAG